jgi:hypothetical protein
MTNTIERLLRCVCAAMVAWVESQPKENPGYGWDCPYHGHVRKGTEHPGVYAEQERQGLLTQVGVEGVDFFATEGGGCRSTVVMAGGLLDAFPHSSRLAVRCPRAGLHPHATDPSSPLLVKPDLSDPSELAAMAGDQLDAPEASPLSPATTDRIRRGLARFGQRPPGVTGSDVPEHIDALRALCRRHEIPCRVDPERRRVVLELPPGVQGYTGALTAAVADVRGHTSWEVEF